MTPTRRSASRRWSTASVIVSPTWASRKPMARAVVLSTTASVSSARSQRPARTFGAIMVVSGGAARNSKPPWPPSGYVRATSTPSALAIAALVPFQDSTTRTPGTARSRRETRSNGAPVCSPSSISQRRCCAARATLSVQAARSARLVSSIAPADASSASVSRRRVRRRRLLRSASVEAMPPVFTWAASRATTDSSLPAP